MVSKRKLLNTVSDRIEFLKDELGYMRPWYEHNEIKFAIKELENVHKELEMLLKK